MDQISVFIKRMRRFKARKRLFAKLYVLHISLLLLSWTYPTNGAADTSWACPNECNGHGACSGDTSGQCLCYQGYIGVDCSLRLCPANKAWVDIPLENNIAHRDFTECSNMGTCDRTTGSCVCREGFAGPACDFLACPTGNQAEATFTYSTNIGVCSGNGRCLSLRELSLYVDYVNYFDEPKTEYTDWDADRIYGCVCDEGWTGAACDLMSCPLGDDPSTPGVNEVQVIDCLCNTCTGGVYLTMQNEQTPFIPYDAPPQLVKYYLEQFNSVQEVVVEMNQGTQLCSNTGSVMSIRFLLPVRQWGSLSIMKTSSLHVNPELFGVRSKGQISAILPSVISTARTKEVAECSNRGTCNRQNGLCMCFPGYSSSDGLGNEGVTGDCGYNSIFDISYVVGNDSFSTPCPVANSQICGGNGYCNSETGICNCYSGYGGANCTWIFCPISTAWFGLVGYGHALTAECSGIGYCDYNTGTCSNCGGNSLSNVFGGDACQYLTCAVDQKGLPCGGNGACLTLNQLAAFAWNEFKELSDVEYTTPWDSMMIQGCACERAISVDNQYYTNYSSFLADTSFNSSNGNYTLQYSDAYIAKFYRGPFAFAATDFAGYNCQKKRCPTGDSPLNVEGVNEIQAFYCFGTNGTFTLTFRENTTLPIDANNTLAQLASKLQQLFTIGLVSVSSTSNEQTICSSRGNYSVFIEFLTEYGELPMLSYQVLSGHVQLYIYREQKGTKFDLECSAMGICNEDTGICQCMKGFQSSNGSLSSPGQRGDCSYFNRFYTLSKQRTSSPARSLRTPRNIDRKASFQSDL